MEVTDEMVEALRRKLQPTPFEPTLRPAAAAVLAIVERDYHEAMRKRLREVAREVAALNAVTGPGMRIAALTVLGTHAAQVGMTGVLNEPGITIKGA